MIVEYENNQFVISFTYNPSLVSAVKQIPGRRFNSEKKNWIAPIESAIEVSQFISNNGFAANEATQEILRQHINKANAILEESKAVSADIEIPKPDGLEYLPYQKAGIQFGLNRLNTLFGDQMGLGKTIEAIGVCNADENANSILIICPASLKINWQREFQKWDTKNRSVEIVNGVFPKSQVVIVNYDILKKHRIAIREREWDILICDEVHYLKNSKALRTKEVFGCRKYQSQGHIEPISAKRKLFLTGTPILNRPIELWTLVHALDAEGIGKSWKYYVERYCDAYQDRFGWNTSGASNLEELQKRLRLSFMIRRLKEDVLTELPPKRRQIITFPSDSALLKVIEKEKQSYEELQERIQSLRVQVELAKASEQEGVYESAVQALNGETQVLFSEISKLRHETAVAKIPLMIEHLKDQLESTGKIVFFAHHHDVMDAIQGEFKDISVKLSGKEDMEERQQAVDSFQNNPKIKLFIGSIKAAGVGITLTASNMVVFGELDWVPGNISQCEDRTHRIGQKESVLIQHLVVDDSLDAKMAQTLVNKQEIIDKALDNEIKFELANIPTIPVIDSATEELTRKQVESEALGITPEQIDVIHKAVKTIASYCDGATALDGMGFSKIDAGIGHSLAGFKSLSAKQAVIGKKLAIKYKRQLSTELVEILETL
jgi:SNF2 family DNA or RNA helicase